AALSVPDNRAIHRAPEPARPSRDGVPAPLGAGPGPRSPLPGTSQDLPALREFVQHGMEAEPVDAALRFRSRCGNAGNAPPAKPFAPPAGGNGEYPLRKRAGGIGIDIRSRAPARE